MFLFHETNFLVEAFARFVDIVRTDVHIEVHGLLFGCGDYHCVENGANIVVFRVNRAFDVVYRVTVMSDRGSAGSNFGVLADKPFGVNTIVAVE